MVFTIHDLIHLRVAEEGSALKRLYFERIVRPAARRAFRVLTVSEYSRREIMAWSGLPPERVVVAGNGVDSTYAVAGSRNDFGAKYVLYVGNRKPHKNLDRMFEAFGALADRTAKLVLSGEPDQHTHRRTERAGIARRILYSGTLADADMPALYRGAEVLIMPSLLEGFGLPVMEAMACGTAVIAARSSSLPEISGGAALLVDPLDVGAMRDGLEAVLSRAELRDELRSKGLERAGYFTWERATERVKEVLTGAANVTAGEQRPSLVPSM